MIPSESESEGIMHYSIIIRRQFVSHIHIFYIQHYTPTYGCGCRNVCVNVRDCVYIIHIEYRYIYGKFNTHISFRFVS